MVQVRGMSRLAKTRHHFPCDLAEHDDLPPFLQPHLPNGNILVSVRLDNMESNFNFTVAHTTTPLQLLAIALQKGASLSGNYPLDATVAEDYVLKVCEKQEPPRSTVPRSLFCSCTISRFKGDKNT